MGRHQHRDTGELKQESVESPKEHNSPLELDPEQKEIYEIQDTDLKIIIVRKLNKCKRKQTKEMKNSMKNINENMAKKTEFIK